MRVKRIVYRLRQFWQALRSKPDAKEVQMAYEILSPPQMNIFIQMQPGEQAHSLAVMKSLINEKNGLSDQEHQALLEAALLHDVGKSRYPLRLWERVVIVLGKALFPDQSKQWGRGEPRGWRRAFVVSEKHAEWGAAMATEAGSSALAVDLIRYHQTFAHLETVKIKKSILVKLQNADQNE